MGNHRDRRHRRKGTTWNETQEVKNSIKQEQAGEKKEHDLRLFYWPVKCTILPITFFLRSIMAVVYFTNRQAAIEYE